MMAQKAQQQRVCDAGRGPDTGPSTPVVITGGGTFPEDTAIPSKLYIASKQNDPPLVFEIVSAGAETEQWSQSRSVSVGFIESVLVGDKLFPVPEHPITISIVAAAGNPLLTIGEMRESEEDGYRMFITSNDPSQTFRAENPNEFGDGWTESQSDSVHELGRIFIGAASASLQSVARVQVQVNFVSNE